MSAFYLAEHHTFAFDDAWHLLQVERMEAFRISPPLAEAIRDLDAQPALDNAQVEPTLLEALDQLGLRLDAPPEQPRVRLPDPEAPLITAIALNVAQLCNLDCIYCYGKYGHKGYMNQETAYQAIDFLIDNAGDAKPVSIWFFGGEPS